MPWSVHRSSRCPASRPWVVTEDADGSLEGCHKTKTDANKQLAALNASESNGVVVIASKLRVRQKPPKLCYRSVEFRATDPITDGRTLEGYAAVFNSPTTIETFFGDFEEEVARGAFRKTLSDKTPVLQFDHGRDARTGSIPIGAINAIREDKHGLFVSARLFENDVVEPIRQAIEAEAINGMSFRFRITREEWRDGDGDLITEDDDLFDLLFDDDVMPRRTVKEVELFELGPVVFPAYDSTSVGVRSLLATLDRDDRVTLVRELAKTVCGDSRAAVSSHDTAVEEGEWDANVNLSRIDWPVSRSVANRVAAVVRDDMVEDGEVPRGAIALPHHFVSTDGNPGAASLSGVRNALSRLPQTQGLSDAERTGAERHLRNHLPAEDNEASSDVASGTSDASDAAVSSTSDRHAEPATVGHSAHLGGATWYLPPPETVDRSI